jgi:hypothetical protein
VYEETEKDKETYTKKKPLGRFLKKNKVEINDSGDELVTVPPQL